MTAFAPGNSHTVPFCGLAATPADAIAPDAVAAVIGGGHSLGTAHEGTENGPFFIRTLSKAYTWSAETPTVLDLRAGAPLLDGVVDLGDITFDGMSLTEALNAIENVVKALPPNVAPCLIGGDHSVTLPMVRALRARRDRPFRVVQFDHHLDLQIWNQGADRSAAAREPIFNTNVMSHIADEIGPGGLVQIGIDPYATVEAAAAPAVLDYLATVGRQICLTSPALDDPEALRDAVGRGGDVYLTVDVDVLDRSAMSATAYPADAGMTVRELLRSIDAVLSENRLIGFDMVEFATPRAARDPKTLADGGRAVAIMLHLLGWLTRQSRQAPIPDSAHPGEHLITICPEA
ncbi:arginase family protein [Micromonospora sp. WMMD737]|uniref:arginase family protein n=1 Tax=Micromonospora sp. WMMD737 TaxID=3404113 RepID=UPI003B96620D